MSKKKPAKDKKPSPEPLGQSKVERTLKDVFGPEPEPPPNVPADQRVPAPEKPSEPWKP